MVGFVLVLDPSLCIWCVCVWFIALMYMVGWLWSWFWLKRFSLLWFVCVGVCVIGLCCWDLLGAFIGVWDACFLVFYGFGPILWFGLALSFCLLVCGGSLFGLRVFVNFDVLLFSFSFVGWFVVLVWIYFNSCVLIAVCMIWLWCFVCCRQYDWLVWVIALLCCFKVWFIC